jgi:hypothetical protein
VSPGIEWRQGFPYTVFEEDYTVAGDRNRGGRFPAFFAADVRVMKQITLFGKKVGIGFELFNLTDHFNPRDVTTNRASARFGEFSNSRGISGGLKLQVQF